MQAGRLPASQLLACVDELFCHNNSRSQRAATCVPITFPRIPRNPAVAHVLMPSPPPDCLILLFTLAALLGWVGPGGGSIHNQLAGTRWGASLAALLGGGS